ncbi:pisatin demethylase [Podospora appendiculata]|uniref:Pisatin demethylase n=1 Tax=Podospora appendiculata TaxID=314037 RepID=A0AAE0XC49_9PEZI|nr:pisatin demethylase [Podospora appendiculata]KAK3689934.1 pisatin demethylase [Podospora appendiculata]
MSGSLVFQVVEQVARELTLVQLLLVAVSLLIAYRAISTIRLYYRLRHIPGPPTTGISKLWMLRNELGGRMNLVLEDITKKYGPIVRIAPNILVTNDPELVKRYLGVRSTWTRSDWYNGSRFVPNRDNIISMKDDKLHTQLRAKMAAGYSGKEVDNFEAMIDRTVLALVDLLETKYIAAGKLFDFARKAQYFTTDVISILGFSEPFGFLANDRDMYNYIALIEKIMPVVMINTAYPFLVRLQSLPIIRRLQPSHTDADGFGKVLGLVRKTAHERFGPNKTVKKDMLGAFVAHGLTMEESESEIFTQIIAGSDTTATAISATMLHIMTSPRVWTRLIAELDAAGLLARLRDSVISDAEARALPYLQAVIKEGLRIHPPVSGLNPRAVPAGGDTFRGIHLPAGTEVGWSSWGITRRTDLWGADAAEFRPERWLDAATAAPEKLREMEGLVDLVFAYGKWQCLGRNVALMELNKVFVEILRRFDLALVDPTKPWKSFSAGLFQQSDMWVRGSLRG